MRYDVNTDTARGYVIFRDGVPYQAGVRLFGLPDPLGFDNLRSWLLPIDGPMPAWLAEWVGVNFSEAINEQAQQRIRAGHSGMVGALDNVARAHDTPGEMALSVFS
jgi:hypothetical protein